MAPPSPSSANMLSSPNPIPPRTSSSGTHSQPSSTAQPASPERGDAQRPVSEADWMSPKQPSNRSSSATKSSSSTAKPHRRYLSASSGTTTIPSAILDADKPRHLSSSSSGQAMPPPPDPSRYASDELDFAPGRSWTADKERIVRGPYDYIVSHPGKDIRAQLIAAFNEWLEVPPASLTIITRVVGMLHESSLLVDDVQDSSELRRGFPVAHSIFGVPQTINSANYMYFAALREIQQLASPEAVAAFADELVNLHRGQGMDLFWRDTLTCPSEDDYLEMVANKTGGLFRLGIKLMQGESKSSVPADCTPLVNLIGLIFQIRDDYMNLSSTEYSDNKGMCEDLTEGKFSFPIIHSIRADPTNLQLINILKQKTTDVQVKRYAIRQMEATGSFEYTRQVLNVLIERARSTAVEIDSGRGKLAGVLRILDKLVVE